MVFPILSDATNPARARIARWALIALGAVFVSAAKSPEGTPSGKASISFVKTSKRVVCESADITCIAFIFSTQIL